jgi:methyl-accepting chemotaxis protein
MACSIIRNKDTKEIEQVLAPNGQESKLYKEILKVNPDKEAALRMWAQVYTPEFKNWFGDWENGKGIPEESVTETKSGVEEVFKINPKLSSIGTPKQYSQYIDSIFPDSQVKDIVYHVNRDTKVSPQDGKAFYTTSQGSWVNELEEMKGSRKPILIDIKNPTIVDPYYEFTDRAKMFRESGLGDSYVTPDEMRKPGTDSVIGRDSGQSGSENSYIIYQSKQVHQLGTDEDAENFKKFLESPSKKTESTSKVLDENGEPMLMFSGSGVNFRAFDKNKLFTGEGAAVYGAGFYFTNNRETASGYKRVSGRKTKLGYEKDRLEYQLQNKDKNLQYAKESIKQYADALKEVNKLQKEVEGLYKKIKDLPEGLTVEYSVESDKSGEFYSLVAKFSDGTKKEFYFGENQQAARNAMYEFHYSNNDIRNLDVEDLYVLGQFSSLQESLMEWQMGDPYSIISEKQLDELKKEYEGYEKRLAQINYLIDNNINNAIAEKGYVFDTFLNIKNPIEWEKEASDDFIDRVNNQLQSEKLEKVGKFNIRSSSIQQIFRDLAIVFGYNPKTREFDYNEETGMLFGSSDDHTAAVKELIEHFSRNPLNVTTRAEASAFMNRILSDIPSPEIPKIFDKYQSYIQSLNEKGIFQIKKKEGMTQGDVYNLLGDNLEEPKERSSRGSINTIHISDFFQRIGYDGTLHITKKDFHHPFGNFVQKAGEKHYVAFEPNQIKSVFNEGTFSTEKNNIYLQKEQQSERPSNEELNKKINRFLTSIGVRTEMVDELRDRQGNLIDAVAKADMLNKIIQVVNGTADITTLPEEAAHFFVEMLGVNNPLYKEMFDKITSYDLYKDVVAKYKDDRLYRNADGTVKFDMLKKEAIGKLIMQHIIEQNDEDEAVKKVEAARSWWSKVWNFIKKIFNQGEKVNEQLDNPFAESARRILANETTDLDTDYKSDLEYLQKSKTGEEAFNKAKALSDRITLDDSVDPKTGKKKHIYVKEGKPIVDADGTARSVNENVVKPWYKRMFPTDKRTDVQKVIDELKAEYGTELHKDIERILYRYIDKNTGLVLDKPIAGDKVKVNAEVEKKLDTYIRGLIRSYGPGARFLAEARIYNQKKNLPGTVDLIVFLPDGSADIYDWKSQEVADGETELKWFKEPAYRLQLDEYRQAIEEQFGVTKFNKIRAIPIRTLFKVNRTEKGWIPSDLKDIEIGPIDPSLVPENKEYLLPVVAKVESTGDVKLDKLVARLNTIYDTLANKSTKEKDKKNIELNKLKKTIRNLQVKKDMKFFVESGLLEIDKYYDKLINNNIDISEVLEARDIINVYGEGSLYLKSILVRLKKSISEETDATKKAELERLQDNYKTMALNAKDLVESLNERAKDLADAEAEKNGIKGLLNPERVMDYMKRNFRSLSQLETSAAQVFYKIRNKAFQVRDLETEDMNEELAKLKEELEKWASSKGLSKDKIFDGILETDKDGKRTGDFLNIYSDEFMNLKRAAIKRGDVAWIRANTTFNSEAYLESFKRYKDIVEGSIYSADPKLDREKKDAAIEKWIELHNGEKSNTAALLPKGNFLRPKDIWWSEKYKDLNKPENAPLKAVYDKFQGLLRDSEKAGMIDYDFGFIPSIIKTKMEGFVLGDMGKILDKQAFLQSLAVDSSVDFGQLDINGKQIKKIPVYYTRDLGADKSFDLFKVFSIWGTHTANYKAMSSIEDTANLLLFVEQNKQSLQTNRFGKVKKNAEPVNNNQVNADVLEKFINFYVYGQKMDASSDFSFKIGDTEISATRGLQKVLRYFSIKTLALNPISGTSNLIGGTANASFIAKKNLYFGDKDWAWGQYKLASRDEKALAFLDYAAVELENQAFHNSNQLSMSDTMKNWTSDKFFIIQRAGDKLVTYPVALAMFRTHMVDENGKIVSIREHVKAKNNYESIYNLPSAERKAVMDKIDKEIEELTESSSLYAKSKKVGDKLEIEGVDRKSDTFVEFRNKIKKMNKSIIGNASQEDINQFRIGMLGQMVMQFRSWIPGLVTERFGDLAYDTDMETYNYGKARVFFKHFVDQKFLPLLGELITGFGDNAIERAKERYQEMVIRRREQGDMNFEERMSEAQFIDMYLGNLRSMTRELLVMLGFLSLVLWAHTVPPDEDKEHNGARKLMAKAMDKYYNEVAFFYNPSEFQSLIKSPIPITGLFTDIYNFGEHTIKEVWGLGTGDEKLVKKSHPMKYFNKMIPVVRQFQDIFALFDKEFRTNWGIKT